MQYHIQPIVERLGIDKRVSWKTRSALLPNRTDFRHPVVAAILRLPSNLLGAAFLVSLLPVEAVRSAGTDGD